jgi:NAD(P)-dependent dehydrogenase (short-subunit alcohol dehydrogenase family)
VSEGPGQAFGGKVAFVTGAARGFGLAFCQALQARGAKVVLADIDVAEAERRATAIGPDALALSCDVADEASVAEAVKRTTDAFGGIDILINNAGLHSAKYNVPFETLGHAEIRRLMDVNIMGVINGSLACKAVMAARGGGSIINIASIAGYSNATPYGVSKLAVRGLTMAFAREFADAKIRVNAIAPGLIGTETIRAELPEIFDQFINVNQLIRRMGAEDDIVSAMLFLVSDQASFITGETLKVAGGFPLSI